MHRRRRRRWFITSFFCRCSIQIQTEHLNPQARIPSSEGCMQGDKSYAASFTTRLVPPSWYHQGRNRSGKFWRPLFVAWIGVDLFACWWSWRHGHWFIYSFFSMTASFTTRAPNSWLLWGLILVYGLHRIGCWWCELSIPISMLELASPVEARKTWMPPLFPNRKNSIKNIIPMKDIQVVSSIANDMNFLKFYYSNTDISNK